MGHGKETPRQKMIGMMYLVLMAMLALNVSKEVLDGFVIVDEGVSKTTENFTQKNETLYGEFEKQATINPKKVEPLKDIVDEVKKRANELYEYMQDLKLQIVIASEGEGTEAIEGHHIHGELIGGKDNTSVPAIIMIGDNNDKEGKVLRGKIDSFRDFLLEHINEKHSNVKEAIEATLDTHDPPPKEGEIHSWESEHFEHLPLISVLANLSVLQANVRNAESDILNYLMAQIDAGSFKFNKLEATVIHNSNYIITGNEYKAEVFLAAFDTTQNPKVYIGRYDSTVSEGVVEYNMIGKYDSLPVKNGRGIYVRPGSSTGFFEWGGLIKIKNSDGTYTTKSFNKEYQVAEGSVVVSPTKMNVFYLGVENPVDISVSGVPKEQIYPEITNGSISPKPPYIVKPKRPGNSIITVFAEIGGIRKKMESKEFRVKTVPSPVATVAGKKGGAITKNELLVQSGVLAEMENFDFDLKFTVTEFTISTTIQGFVRFVPSSSNRITEEQRTLIGNLNRGQNVYFEDIKAIGPDGTVRNLPTIKFKII